MLTTHRKQQILSILKRNGQVIAKEVSQSMGVSEDTVAGTEIGPPSRPISQICSGRMSRYGTPEGVMMTELPSRTLILPALPTARPSSSRRRL